MNSSARSNVDPADLLLVQQAARGDSPARRELFERYHLAAYQVALRITGRNEDALDVVQDSFIKAFDSLAGYERNASFKTWLLRIVTNRALDALRARRVRLAIALDRVDDDDGRSDAIAPASGGPAPDAGLQQRELAERLREALDSLSAEQRAAFALFAEGDMTYAQIAEALGIPIGTVMSRLFHARKRLGELLPDLAPDKDDA